MKSALLLALAGCSIGSPAPTGRVAACSATSPSDDVVFAALTAVEWDTACDIVGGLPTTCDQLQLRADGHFSWRAVSDVVERDQSGGWSFQARSDHEGIVCLDTGAVLAFALQGNQLMFGPLGFSSGMALTASGSRGDLPEVTSDPIYARLLAHAWTKSNRFDLYRLAQDFTLASDGTFTASYRDGACTHGGTWSIDVEPRTAAATPVWWAQSDANACDLRSGGTYAELDGNGGTPSFEDGRLVLDSSAYRAADASDTRSWFSFDSYSASVATSGTLDTELSASSPTQLDLVFDNRSDTTMTLTSFAIRATPVVWTSAGYQSAGATIDLATLNLGAESLATAAQSSHSVTVSPPAGDIQLALELDYADATQLYTGQQSYFVTVGQ